MLVDSHAHLTAPELLVDVEAILQRASLARVSRIVNICTDEASLQAGLAVSQQHPELVLTAATTPHDVEREGESFFPSVAREVAKGTLVAIGETGLDYHYQHALPELQRTYLERYLALASGANLPVVIHCREAFEDLFAMLDAIPVRGVLHCFTGTLAEAEGVIERGLYLSLSGIVTFKRSDALREVARQVPLDRLLIETDSPYLAPQGRRGQRNEPAFVVEVAEVLAACRELSLEEVASATSRNASALFGFSG